ncbi:hypothetical protein OA336_02550 [Flavobacteriaceae bacterium]|nr:hypothetical protein [Flavobacteriaceae bacterium]
MYKFNTNDYLIRIPLFVIFFWFGLLKVIELSPAQGLIIDTVYWMPFLRPEDWVIVIGYWEMLIGLFFLAKKTTFYAMLLLFLQMSGTFMPLLLLPSVTFQNSNFLLPTLEGQYIIKNIIIITSAIVVGRYYLNQPFFERIAKLFSKS